MTQYTNESFYVNGSVSTGDDLSSFLQSLDVQKGVETNDNTAMGATDRTAEAGQDTYAVSVVFVQSYAPGGPHEALKDLPGTETEIDVVRVSVTGDDASGTQSSRLNQIMFCESYEPQYGSVGDLHLCRAQFIGRDT